MGIFLWAIEDNITYFYSPTRLAEEPPPEGRLLRLGGLVEEGSVERTADGLTVRFRITDLAESVPVTYRGILPDLFREGQGVVSEGVIGPDGLFRPEEVLAKHDETYMPPEVAEALKESGQWRGDEAEPMIPEAGDISRSSWRCWWPLPCRAACRSGARRAGGPSWMALARPAAVLQLLLMTAAFLALTRAYVTSDFTVLNVVENSHSAKPLIYKITGVWGNHEGSMLLWVLILALFGAAVALFGGNLPRPLQARVLAVQAWIAFGFLAFTLLTSNPFARVVPPPASTARTSTPCCRTRASPSIRRCSTPATSASRSPSPSPSPP